MSILGFNYKYNRIKVFQRLLAAILIVLMLPFNDASHFFADIKTNEEVSYKSNVSVKNNKSMCIVHSVSVVTLITAKAGYDIGNELSDIMDCYVFHETSPEELNLGSKLLSIGINTFTIGVSALSVHLTMSEYQKAFNNAPQSTNITEKATWVNTEAFDDVASKADDVMIEARNSDMVLEGGSDVVPESLLKGKADTMVYYGIIDGEKDYVGITNNLSRRQAQHGKRFDRLIGITGEPLTRRQARAIEQVLIEDNPQFSNRINSISSKRDWYNDATEWARKWLSEHEH